MEWATKEDQPMPGKMTITATVRIIVADHQSETCVHYQTVLPGLGYKFLSAAQTGRELIEQCRKHGPDLVLADSNLPDMDVVDAAEEVCSAERLPFIVTADHFDPQQIMRNGADHVWAYLIKPINSRHLESVIPFVLHRFKKMQALFMEIKTLRVQVNSGLETGSG
jgi:two-component system, response regulator PdtaR